MTAMTPTRPISCPCPLCAEEAVATAAWRKHAGSIASFIKEPPVGVDPFASADVRWAIRNMRRLRADLPGFDRALREIGEVFSPKRGRGHPTEAPYMAVVAAAKLELRKTLAHALRSDEPTATPPLWPEEAGSFEEALAKWKKSRLSPAIIASVWLYEIEGGRGADVPEGDRLVDRADSFVQALRKMARQRREPKSRR